MKLEPNMYVRTLFGIKKIDHIDNKKTVSKYLYKINDDNEFYALSDNDVIKASNNIIDLIEAGDYVNGSKVMNIVEEDGTKYLVLDRDEVYYDSCLEPSSDNDIKSIVTKEMFESMQYKVD